MAKLSAGQPYSSCRLVRISSGTPRTVSKIHVYLTRSVMRPESSSLMQAQYGAATPQPAMGLHQTSTHSQRKLAALSTSPLPLYLAILG